MTKPSRIIALVEIGAVGQEAQAIRNTLEYFGCRVIYIPVGRPLDWIAVLNRKALYKDVQDLIICAHGVDGHLIMPELSEELYKVKEPRGAFTPGMIQEYAHLEGLGIINTACTLGRKKMAEAFLSSGCKYYIGVRKEVEGNAALVFVQNFYYHLCNDLSLNEAFEKASRVDSETSLFVKYD